MRNGSNHIVAGGVAALAIPLGVFALHLPFLVMLPVAAALYAGVALSLAPPRAVDRVNPGEVGHAQAQLVAELIEQGEACAARLRVSARGLRSARAGKTAMHLATVAQGILVHLAAEPGKLPAVRRFLTYYLPRAAEIAEGLEVVEQQHTPSPQRLADIETMLDKLDQAFTFYADSFAQAELDTLDVELKLLGRALADDLGPPRPAAVEPMTKGS